MERLRVPIAVAAGAAIGAAMYSAPCWRGSCRGRSGCSSPPTPASETSPRLRLRGRDRRLDGPLARRAGRAGGISGFGRRRAGALRRELDLLWTVCCPLGRRGYPRDGKKDRPRRRSPARLPSSSLRSSPDRLVRAQPRQSEAARCHDHPLLARLPQLEDEPTAGGPSAREADRPSVAQAPRRERTPRGTDAGPRSHRRAMDETPLGHLKTTFRARRSPGSALPSASLHRAP